MTNDQEITEPPNKKPKSSEFDLKSFVIDKTLNSLSREKLLIVTGKCSGSDNDSLLIFEKSPFPEDQITLQNSITADDCLSKTIMSNDIYQTQHLTGLASVNTVKLTVIHPATEKHIEKYRKPRFHFVSETPAMFASITSPEIARNHFSIKWIDNLLNGTAEQDRILIPLASTENRFVMAMDYKWDGKTTENLHCLAIVDDRSLKSLRDLGEAHLPLLREIVSKCKSSIETKFGVPKSQLRLYFHYPPSFYHLHVHVTHLHDDGGGVLVDRAHLVNTVIDNIAMKGDYYQHATMEISVNENDSLFDLFGAAGSFR